MKLFFDTETTGKTNMRGRIDDANQPHIVQLGAIFTDDDGAERGSIDVIIKPNGWTIPKEASDIHGITTEDAERCGVSVESALSLLSSMVRSSEEIVAHNIDFDAFMLHVELSRLERVWKKVSGFRDRLDLIPMFCTMKSSTDICKIPGMYGNKWPKLSEAYMHFFGEELTGAHDAMTDLRACKRIYFAIQNLNSQKSPSDEN